MVCVAPKVSRLALKHVYAAEFFRVAILVGLEREGQTPSVGEKRDEIQVCGAVQVAEHRRQFRSISELSPARVRAGGH